LLLLYFFTCIMFKEFILLLFFTVLVQHGAAQVVPAEGSLLNYRLAGFSVAGKEQISECRFEIADGDYSTEDSFNGHLIKTVTSKRKRAIIELPWWSHAYTWRAVYKRKDLKTVQSRLYHFNTDYSPDADTDSIRLRIIQPASKYKDAYVFLDENRALYNMRGEPVWFMPKKFTEGDKRPRDLKVSSKGTITFLISTEAYGINYNGDVLWKGPDNKDLSDKYGQSFHHDLTQLSNGHYMVLGDEAISMYPLLEDFKAGKLKNCSCDDVKRKVMEKSPAASPARFGTVIEYDKNGKIVWSWRSFCYFIKSDIINYGAKGPLDLGDLHENSFYFDESAKCLYVGFRRISRILKIKYPEGKVTGVYGEIFRDGESPKGNGLFCQQHSVKHSEKGYLLLYNNNLCDSVMPSIMMLREPSLPKEGLKKIWEYTCTMEADLPKQFHQGGNIIELPGNSFFVSMGSPYSKVFIVGMDKKIVWSALPEKWDNAAKKWLILPEYRASIIVNRNDIERMVLPF